MTNLQWEKIIFTLLSILPVSIQMFSCSIFKEEKRKNSCFYINEKDIFSINIYNLLK